MNDYEIQKPLTRSDLIGDLFGRYAREFFSPYLDSEDKGFNPNVEIHETTKGYIVRIELPDMKEEDIVVLLQDNSLIIEGSRKKNSFYDSTRSLHSEFHYGDFHRTIPLKFDVDDNQVTAEYKRGILTVMLVKREDGIDKTRRIPIN